MPVNRTKYFNFLLTPILLFFVSSLSFAQADIPKKPIKETSVYDEAKMLSGGQKNALEQKLINYADTTSTQIVVATVKTIKGEDIAFYAAKWAQKWGIGHAKEDNGIFVLVAEKERRLTISTGYGVEHLLTDALSKRIIENIITPAFKQGNFYEGLDRGTSAIMQVMSGEYQGTPEQRNSKKPGVLNIFMILFFIILLIILSNRRGRGGRGGRRRGVAGSILEAIILSNAGRGGFGGGGFGGSSGGGSFGGGGFGGGFGGGGFGGGGASGGW